MFSPNLKEAKEISKNEEYKRIPISYELFSDIATPIEVLRILKGISNHTYMLESVEDSKKWGRYTFLGFDPKLSITCIDGELKVGDVKIKTANPSEHIRQVLSEYKSVRFDNLPPFTGGLVGYFAFDYLIVICLRCYIGSTFFNSCDYTAVVDFYYPVVA